MGALSGLGYSLGGLFSGGGAEWDSAEGILRSLAQGGGEAGPSAYSAVLPDVGAIGNQAQSLEALKSIAAGNLQPMDVTRQRQAMDTANANERGQRGAVMQRFASRGMAGSGAELASQLANEQGSANRNAAAGAQFAGDANQRALQAIASTGNLATTMRGQTANEQGTKAGGVDAMSRFNAGQRVRGGEDLADFYGGKAGRKQQQGKDIGGVLGGLADAGLSAFTGGLF